jgi:hypothetical protein
MILKLQKACFWLQLARPWAAHTARAHLVFTRAPTYSAGRIPVSFRGVLMQGKGLRLEGRALQRAAASARFWLGGASIGGGCCAGSHMRWYLLAAAQGHAGAQNNLGFMFHDGCGVPQDREEDICWYRLAAGQGHSKAAMSLSRLGVSRAGREMMRSRRAKCCAHIGFTGRFISFDATNHPVEASSDRSSPTT